MVTGLSKYEQDLIRQQFKEAEERIIEKIHARMLDLSKDKKLRDRTDRELRKTFALPNR